MKEEDLKEEGIGLSQQKPQNNMHMIRQFCAVERRQELR